MQPAPSPNIRVPEFLNGYPVIASATHPNCATVMVERVNDQIRYVVATWWPTLETAWSWGHYSETKREAERDFFQASQRNERR